MEAQMEMYLCLFRKEIFNAQWAQVLGLISLRLNFLTFLGQFLMAGTASHEKCFWLCLAEERYRGLYAPNVSWLLRDQSCYQKNLWGCFSWKCQPSELGWCNYPDTAIPANLPTAKAEQRCKTLTFMFYLSSSVFKVQGQMCLKVGTGSVGSWTGPVGQYHWAIYFH